MNALLSEDEEIELEDQAMEAVRVWLAAWDSMRKEIIESIDMSDDDFDSVVSAAFLARKQAFSLWAELDRHTSVTCASIDCPQTVKSEWILARLNHWDIYAVPLPGETECDVDEEEDLRLAARVLPWLKRLGTNIQKNEEED